MIFMFFARYFKEVCIDLLICISIYIVIIYYSNINVIISDEYTQCTPKVFTYPR